MRSGGPPSDRSYKALAQGRRRRQLCPDPYLRRPESQSRASVVQCRVGHLTSILRFLQFEWQLFVGSSTGSAIQRNSKVKLDIISLVS